MDLPHFYPPSSSCAIWTHLWATLVLSSWNSLKDNAALTCYRTTRMHIDVTPRQFIRTHIFAGHFFCGHYLTTKNVKIVPPPPQKNKNKNKKHAIRCTHTNTCTHMLTLKHACTRTNTHIHTCMYSSFSLHLHCILVKLHVP